MIQEDLKGWLEIDFEEEIRKALLDCVGAKAPGLDGFNFTFIKAAWDVLKEGFCRMLSEFNARGKLNGEMNTIERL